MTTKTTARYALKNLAAAHKIEKLAESLGVTSRVVHYWIKGHCSPNLKTAFKLEAFTKGKIKASDWLL